MLKLKSKIYFLQAAILLTISNASIAKRLNKVNAYYINISGDTINGELKLPYSFCNNSINFELLQKKIYFIDKDNKKQKLKPLKIKEYGYVLGEKKIVMRSIKNTYIVGSIFNLNKNLFMKLITDGKLKQYEFTFKRYSSGGGYMATGPGISGNFNNGYSYKAKRVFIQKNNEEAILVTPINFNKKVKTYLGDCSELLKKIETDSYTMKSIHNLVMDYNALCY